jgi:5-carboxymethyl-2-hydroxymuconate isomerase
MPHFVIDCSENILRETTPDKIMTLVYDTANASGLFASNDIKVRLQPFRYYKLGENKKGFLHIFAHIMEGRSVEQKEELSRKIITNLKDILPDIAFLSINIYDFELATYSNKSLINPGNKNNDRHFELK